MAQALAEFQRGICDQILELRGERYATHLIATATLGMLLSSTENPADILEAIEADAGRSIDALQIRDGNNEDDMRLRETIRFHLTQGLDGIRQRFAQ